jgi:hypothetical protein
LRVQREFVRPQEVTPVFGVLGRTGQVGWRSSNAVGRGATPAAALVAAVASFLPDIERP